MSKHSSHDWNSDTGRCNACDAHVLAFEANYRCIPVKVMSPFDGPPLDDDGDDWWATTPDG